MKSVPMRLGALAMTALLLLGACPLMGLAAEPDDASGFVSLAEAVPDVILEIRYYSTYNFVGDSSPGRRRRR